MQATNRRFRIMGLLFVTVVINYLDRSNISIAAPALKEEFHLDPVQLGLAGILSPIAIGFLLKAGDFRLPLVFIAIIEAMGVFSYIFVVGKLERVKE